MHMMHVNIACCIHCMMHECSGTSCSPDWQMHSMQGFAAFQLNAQLLYEYSGNLYLSDIHAFSWKAAKPYWVFQHAISVGVMNCPKRLALGAGVSLHGLEETRCCSPGWSQLWRLSAARLCFQLSVVGGAWQVQPRTRIRWGWAWHLCLLVLQLQLRVNHMLSLYVIECAMTHSKGRRCISLTVNHCP